MSDHGEGFDHNYYFNHGRVLYNSNIRVPILIRHPLLSKSKVIIPNLITNTDIYTTIRNQFGFGIKGQNEDGIDFNGLLSPNPLTQFTDKKREYVYLYSMELQKYGIYDGRFKYIYSLNDACLTDGFKEEIYDTQLDPQEVNNIIQSAPKEKTRLKTRLFEYLGKYNLPMLESKDVNDADKIRTLETIKSLGY